MEDADADPVPGAIVVVGGAGEVLVTLEEGIDIDEDAAGLDEGGEELGGLEFDD